VQELVWKTPTALWLLWALPALVGLAVLAHRGTRRAAEAFAGTVMAPRLMPPLTVGGPIRRTVLLVSGLGLAAVAAAGPAFGVYYLPTKARGLDLAVVLDVSRSMLADDGGDTRLGRARSAISWLVEDLRGDRAGLVLFAGQTVQACPLTLDRGFFRTALDRAGPGAVGRGGTQIGPALDEALRMLDTSWDRDKLVLLVTDGGDQESFPKTAADRLKERKVRVIALGLGDPSDDAPLVLDGQVVRQADGQPVAARLNDSLLRELAVTTDGMYVPPDAAVRLPDLYAEHFGDLRRGDNQEVQEKHHRERYQWFLLPAILLLLAQAGAATYGTRRASGSVS
jgi:Ca-activated chloride channel family protein